MADDTKKLLLQIDATTELLRRNLATGDGAIARFEADTKRRLNTIDRSFSGLGRGVDNLRGRFSAFRGTLAAIGVAFGIREIAEFTRRSFEMGSALAESAQQIGVTARALQIYRYIGGQVGIEQETMDRSLAKLNRTLGQAALGAAAPTRALRSFGFSLVEIRRGLTVEEVIPRLADGLSHVESSARRAAVEALFFGRTGQQLDNMLAGGRGQIDQLSAAAERLGLILSDEQIQRLDEAHDKYEALKTVLAARIAAVVADNADAILTLVDALANLVVMAGRAVGAWRNLRLEVEAQQLEASLNVSGTPPEWGMGGTGHPLTAQERMATLQRLQAVRNEQLSISRANDPNYHPPTAAPAARRPARSQAPDLDNLEGDHGPASTTRTDAQAMADFERELAARGIHRNRGRSGFRTYRDQAEIYAQMGPGNAARPGTSDHEAHRALDLPANVDWAKVQEAARAAGINGLEPLVHGAGSNRHTHASWSGHGLRGQGENQGGGEVAALREQAQFDTDMRRAHITVLTAQRDLSTDYSERATLSTQILDQEKKQEFATLQMSVTMGERTQAQVDQLEAEYNTADALRRQQIIVEEQTQRREEYERLQAVSLEIQRGLLQGESDLATTAAERRRVELRILDLAYQEEHDRLQRIVALGRGDADEEEARRRLAALPAQHAQQVAQTRAQTRGPLEEYLATLPRTADELNEALQRVAASGLQSLNEGIVDAIMGAKSLGDVFKSVANQIIRDLLRIAIQRAVIEPLANSLFGGSSGSKGGGGDLGALLSSLFAAFGGGKAIGGGVSPNRTYMVGERGPELFRPSAAGSITPNHALGRAGGAPERIEVHVSLDNDMLQAQVIQTSAGVVAKATPGIAAREASRIIAKLVRRKLP